MLNKNLDVYSKYCELSMSNNSNPVMFCDIFGFKKIQDEIKVSKKIKIELNYSSRVKIKNINISGEGSLCLVIGFSAVFEFVNIHIPKGTLFMFVGPFSEIKNLNVQSFDHGNYLHFGAGNTFNKGSVLIQGSKKGIFFGHDCMFSTEFHARTSDSHSVFSYESRNRINLDKSIKVGDHVWFGRHVIVNKGTSISDDVILGQGSIISGVLMSSCCYAGIPAKCIKEFVTWERDRQNCLDDINNTYHYRPRQLAINKFLTKDKPFHPSPTLEYATVRNKFLVAKKYQWIPPL